MKNAHIVHKIKNKRYLCIRAVDPTPEKSVRTWDKVTCKNCLARMPPEAKHRMNKKASAESIRKKTYKTRRKPSAGVEFSSTPPFSIEARKIPIKLKLVKQEDVNLFQQLAYSAGYAKGMKDGIIGNYIIVAAAIILALLLVILL